MTAPVTWTCRTVVTVAAAGVPLATVLADPTIARAVARELEPVSIRVPGGRSLRAVLALPEDRPSGAVLLIHDGWGLTDQMQAVAAELAGEGHAALAVDLMNGAVATTPAEAGQLAASIRPDQVRESLGASIEWLKAQDFSTGKVATIGWCLGGGWSLQASLAVPVDATVIYDCEGPDDPAALSAVKGPVLGHFGTAVGGVPTDMVQRFDNALTRAGKMHILHRYDAGHGFANPTGNNYDRKDVRLAWTRTLEFLKANLR